MMKLSKSTVKNNPQALKAPIQLSPEELKQQHEQKKAYYRDLFWLEFPIYDEDEVEAQGGIDNVSYFERGSFFDLNDEDVIYYQKKFAGIDELNYFYDLCIDHCQDTLVVLQKLMKKYPLLTDLYAKEFAASRNHKNKAPDEKQQEHHMHKLMKEQMEKVERNQRAQTRVRAQIALIQKRKAELNKTTKQTKTNTAVAKAEPSSKQSVEAIEANPQNKLSKTAIVTSVAMVPEITR